MNATVTPQVEAFVDALMADQHDAAVRQVFADYRRAFRGAPVAYKGIAVR